MAKQKTTAIVPQAELAKIEKETSLVVRKAEEFQVKKVEDENNGYDILKQIKDRLKTIEEMRTGITVPLNASLKATNKLFKTLSTPLKEANDIIQDKIMDFREKREEAAEKKRAALVTTKMEEDEDITEEEAEEEAELEVAPRVGKSHVAKIWKFSIVDITKVPRKYLIICAPSVNQAIRDGVREIPGLDVYQEEGLRVR